MAAPAFSSDGVRDLDSARHSAHADSITAHGPKADGRAVVEAIIAAPQGLKAAVTAPTQITLNWQAPAGASGERVFEWDGSRVQQIATLGPGASSLVVAGLAYGTEYFFYVQAYSSTGSAHTDWVGATTPPQPISVPAQFTLKAVSGTEIDVSWSAAPGATGYQLYGWNGHSMVLLGTFSSATTFAVKGLTPGTLNWFLIHAFNPSNQVYTAWKSAVTPPAAPLLAPTGFTARSDGEGDAVLRWTDSAGAVGYRVWVYDGTSWSQRRTVAPGVGQTVVGGLVRGRGYWFLVDAYTADYIQDVQTKPLYVIA
jgi:hypothetical protein